MGGAKILKHYQVFYIELETWHFYLSFTIAIFSFLFIHSFYVLLSEQFQFFVVTKAASTLGLDQILNQHFPIEALLLYKGKEFSKINLITIICFFKLILEMFPFSLGHSTIFPEVFENRLETHLNMNRLNESLPLQRKKVPRRLLRECFDPIARTRCPTK